MAAVSPSAPALAHSLAQQSTIALPEIAGANLGRLYRAHVEVGDYRGAERTAFIEAASHQCACRKIAAAVAALEHRAPAEVADRIYNCFSVEVGDIGPNLVDIARRFRHFSTVTAHPRCSLVRQTAPATRS